MDTQIQVTAVLEVIANWAANHAPKGLILADNAAGNANGAILNAYIDKKGLSITLESLSAAAEAEKLRLNWEPGFEPNVAPTAPARPKGDKFNQMLDAGVRPFRAPGSTHAERQADAARAKEDAERQRQAAIAKQKDAESLRKQHAEETQLIFRQTGPYAGQVDWPATFAAREAAKKRGSQADNRAVPAVPEEIPAGTKDFTPYSADQIRRYLQRDTNRYAVKNR